MTIFVGAMLIGITLGLLGSGGSAVTVPILVYFVGHDAKIAIAESMAIVGIISLIGAIPKAMERHVDWKSVIWFGTPAMVGTYIGAWLGGRASDALQLTVFGAVVIATAVMMLRNAFGNKPDDGEVPDLPERRGHDLCNVMKIITEGIVVGALTGFVGVAGGFLIVPALLMLERLPIRVAIGTSLIIVAMKSIIGFGKYQMILLSRGSSADLQTIVIFSLVGLAGCAIGQKLNKKMKQDSLKKVFAIFLVLIGGFVFFREGGKLLQSNDEKPKVSSTLESDDPSTQNLFKPVTTIAPTVMSRTPTHSPNDIRSFREMRVSRN